MIAILFSLLATGDFYTWYISPNGSMSNDGTEAKPYAMNVDEINKKMKRIGYSCNFKLVLMEGDYHIPGNYGLSFSDKITGSIHSIHITSQENKRVRFIGGQQIKNWTYSTLYPHLWTTSIGVQISELFVNDKRATVSRVPKVHQKARTLYFTKYDDPDDSTYEIRKYWVQHDCIELLSNLPEDELHKARITDFHGGRWNPDGMFVGTGIAGVIMKNNLVHDISHDAMKMDHGVNITLHNNILAYANYMMTWTKYVADTFTFNIGNNIFDNQYVYIMTGPWESDESKYYIDKNIYWHQTDTSKLSWDYFTFEKWQEKGNDLKSYVTDPLFVNVEKRDFNFKSNVAYEKIGFKPFSMTFGVVGDKWRENAANYKQEEPYGTPINSPVKGTYGFEDDENECIIKIVSTISKAEISADKKHGDKGKNSLKLESTGGKLINKDRPNIATILNWNEGVGEFSLMAFMSEGTRVHFDMNLGKKIIIENGLMSYNDKEIGSTPVGEWFELKVRAGYGNDNDGTFTVFVNGNKASQIEATFKNTPQALFEVVNATSNVFVDNINANLSCKDLDYFEGFIKNKNENEDETYDSSNDDSSIIEISTTLSDDDDDDDSNDKSKKKKTVTIAVVVVVVIVVAGAVIGVVIYFIMKKRKEDEHSEMIELNV